MTENISAAAANARETSRQTDGKFGTQPAAEAEIDLDAYEYEHAPSPEAAQAIKQVEAMGESGSDQIWYFTGGPSERLDDDEINAVLAGNKFEAVDSIRDNYREYIDATQREAAEAACDEADVEWDELNWQDQQAIVQAVDSNSDAGYQLYKQLLSNTPSQLVRRRLDDHSKDDFTQRAYEAGVVWGNTADYEVRERAVVEHLTGYGIDFTDERNREAVAEKVASGPHDLTDGVKLELISYNDVDDLAPDQEDKAVTFTDPHVLLIDTMSGSGADAQLFGTMSVPVPAAPEENDQTTFYTDSGAPGYGWDDVAGVHKPGYRTVVTVTVEPSEDLAEEPASV
ncbi:hypothetical protein [Kocuria arenosa]|uniref:hypothetical protein n=1 Tax=Kocuria arenosa TaxID=3071446 RepID=UPI0034D78578